MNVIELLGVSAFGAAERGRARAVLANVSLQIGRGVLAIIGARKDGTALLLDVIGGTTKPRAGRIFVLRDAPANVRARVAHVSLDAVLPDAFRVDEVCDLAADLRGELRRPANESLAVLGASGFARRRVSALSIEERRTVALALALSSSKVEVILVEEPLLALDPVAPRLVMDAIRARAVAACVIVTTASARDAARLGDRLGVLTAGAYTPIQPEHVHVGAGKEGARVQIVVSPSHGKSGVAAIVSALGGDEAVLHVETSSGRGGAGIVSVFGRDLTLLAKAVTRAIGSAGVDVDLIEPNTLALDAIRMAVAARAASPPRGSLPPGPGSIRPSAFPPSGAPTPAQVSGATPPVSLPPASMPPTVPPASAPSSGGAA